MDSTSARTTFNPEIVDPPITQAVAADATPSNALPSNDVVMSHVGSGEAREPTLEDDNLPQWLTSMYNYLRGAAQDTAWQDLVTEFLNFEKRGPPNGVSFRCLFFFLFSHKIDNLLNSTYLRSSDPKRSLIGSRAKRRIPYHHSNATMAIDSRSGGSQSCHLGGRPNRRDLFPFPTRCHWAKRGRY